MTDYANGTTPRILLRAYLSSDHITDATGKTIAVTISKNGAAFGNPAAGATNATEISNGWYYVTLGAGDTDTNGPLIVRGTAASTDTAEMCCDIVPANNGRLAGIPNAVAGASGGLLISGSNSGTTTLGALTVTGATTLTGNVAAAAGITITQSSSNTPGLSVTGNGTGEGILVTGGSGASGAGMKIVAASTNGYGLHCVGTGANAGFYTKGGATGPGWTVQSGINSNNAALQVLGNNTGHGLSISGGTVSGNAIDLTTTSGHAISAVATGTTMHGIHAAGGATTSHGINAVGGGVGHGILATSGGGATGDGIRATAASTNGNGLNLIGVGTGSGQLATGGATGHGVKYLGGATSGDGMNVAAATSGKGINAAGVGTTMAGILATGGATTSAGIAATGGATSGDGLLISAPTLGHGISSTAAGTSKHGATLVAGGTTAVGLNIVGGSTSGDGIKVVTTSGHGVNLAPVGTSMHGILSTGGNGGTSDGIKAAAGTGGVDIRGNITGNLVGTVSTLTTYTGNTVQTGDNYARLGSPAGASVSADIAAAKVDTAAIKTKTDSLTFTSAGKVDSNALQWNSLTTVALPLIPTVAGRTLDCSAGGEAGVDWANIGSATTTNALTGTTIATTQKVDIETIKTNPVVNGGTITFPTTATLASTTNITAGTITTATNVTNAVTVGTINSTATNLKKNTALAAFEFVMTDSTTHALKTGVTVTATRSLDGAAFGACANSVSEVAFGVYTINLAAGDMNANVVTLRFTGTGSDDTMITLVTQP